MDFLKIIIFVLIIQVVSIETIYAQTPPDLPINIYGKIISESGMPVEGIEVYLSWTDNQGTKQSTSTTTLTSSYMINGSSYPGFYRFEEIDAPIGSDIEIICFMQSTIIQAIAGTVIKVPDIVLKSAEYMPQDGMINESLFSKILGFFGDIYKSTLDLFIKDIDDQDNLDKNQSGGVENLGTSGEDFSKVDTIADGTNNLSSDKERYNQQDNSLLNGDGTILTNVSNDTTENNSTLSANYNDRRVDSPKDQDPEINMLDYNESSSKIKYNESESIVNRDIDKTSPFNKDLKNKAKTDNEYDPKSLYLKIIGIIMILALISFFVMKFLGHDKAKKSPDKNLKVSIRKIDKVNTRQFMKDEIITVNESDCLYEVIEIFSKNNINAIPVLSSGFPKGIITKKELISKVKDFTIKNLQKSLIKDFMSKNFVEADTSSDLGEIYTKMLEKGVDEVIVVNEGKIVGYIDFFDILSILSSANFEIINPPLLGQRMDKEVVFIDYKESLENLRNLFVKNNCEYALVKKNNSAAGIITAKDLIVSVYKEMDLKKTLVQNVMSTNVLFMDPGTSVTDTFDIVLERRFNQLPIIEDKKIVGIVSVKYLVSLYYEFILEIRESSRKIFYGPLDWWKRFNE